MYIVSVKLSLTNSFEMRKLLKENNFIIYLLNCGNGQLTLDHVNYDLEGEILYFDNNPLLSFHCFYNDEHLPPQEILKRFEEDKSVLEYSINKKQ